MWWKGLRLPLAHIGLLLQVLRENRDRSIAALVAAMLAQGYDLRVAAYMEIESGIYLPENGEQFLTAYANAMGLNREEFEIVATQWAFEVLRREFGEDMAWQILGGKLAGNMPLP